VIENIYRIVYFPLIDTKKAEPDALLVLDVVSASRLDYNSSDGIQISAWVYSPLAKPNSKSSDAQTVHWETQVKQARINGTMVPAYTRINFWDNFNLLQLVPTPSPAPGDQLAGFLKGRQQRQDSVLAGNPPRAMSYFFGQVAGFPSFFLNGLDLDDLADNDGLRLAVPELTPSDCQAPVLSPSSYWTTRAFFVPANNVLGGTSRTYNLLVFRLTSPDPSNCSSLTKTSFLAFDKAAPVEFEGREFPNGWTVVHRPAVDITAGAGNFDPNTAKVSLASIIHIFNIPGRFAVKTWAAWSKDYYDALWSVSGGQPVSFLPSFQNQGNELGPWVMTYRMNTYPADFALDRNKKVVRRGGKNHFFPGSYGDHAPPAAPDTPPTVGVVISPRSLHLQEPETPRSKGWQMNLGRVFDVYGDTISQLTLPIASSAPKASNSGLDPLDQPENTYGIALRYKGAATFAGNPPPKLVRMGSLDLALGGARTNDSDQNTDNWLTLSRDQGMTRVHVDARLMVSEVLPGGQDDPPGEEYVPDFSNTLGASSCGSPASVSPDPNSQLAAQIEQNFRRKRPLVIHVDPVTQTDGGYTLQIAEDVAPFETRAMTLTVYSQNPNPSTPNTTDMCDRPNLRKALVLDRNPFLVAEVLYTSFEAPGNDRGSIIAMWSNTNPQQGATWMLQFNQQPFCLVMPPQAVGEEMVKGKMADRPDFPAAGVTALPFRFSANALLTVDPRKQMTSFSEAPWNLRRILGTPQDPLPGPMVNRMQYELLYGLSCDITQPAFRLADLMARIGQIPGRRTANTVWTATGTQANAYNIARSEWADIYRRYLSRIAVLEPWDGIINSTTTSVSLKDGLSCIIRPGADMANPIVPEVGKLRGGVTWGFESKNIYDQVMTYRPTDTAKNPTTTAASLDTFSLSTLGGWGKQTAEFLPGGTTKVYADVEMGRTSTYKLDRIGRLGAWWVLAKHVIVYQRSVTPSRQFFSEQPQYKGWPVLRKVEEYVEILEDARPYPDNPGLTDPQQLRSAQQACGPVKSILLKKGTRFNVDSAWGADVNRSELSGWKVPLWTPGAWPPDVYPKPAIGIGAVVADGTSGIKQPPVCDNPDNIFFFTLTGILKDGKMSPDVDPDPRKWPAVLDVDFVNAPVQAPPEDFKNADLRQTVPIPAAVPPAFGPCTYRLRPGAAATNLMADRASKQMAVVLETITVSRAVVAATVTLNGAAATVQGVQRSAGDLYASLLRALPRDPSVSLTADVWKDLQNAVTGATGGVQKATDAITDAAKTINGVAGKIQSDAKDFEQGLSSNFRQSLTDASTGLLADYKKYVDSFSPDPSKFDLGASKLFIEATQRNFEQTLLFPTSTPGSLASMVARLVDAAMAIKNIVESAAQTFEAALAQWQTQKDAAIQDLNTALLQAISIANGLKTLRRPLESLPDLYIWASSQLGPIVTGIEAASNDFITKLNSLGANDVAQARQTLQTFRASGFFAALNGSLPANVKALVIAAQGETVSTLDDVYQKLHKADVWIQGFPRDTPVGNTGQLALWAQQCKTIHDGINTYQDMQKSVAVFDTYLNVTLLGAINGLLHDVQNQANTVSALFAQEMKLMQSKLQASVDALSKMLNDAQATGIQTIDALRQELEKRRDDLSQQAEAYLDKTFRQVTDSSAYQTADATFRLIRAFGAPPQVPNLGFDRDKIGYFFKQIDPQVDITPVLARVAQTAQAFDTLKTLGTALPTLGVLEQLVPPNLQGFNLSDIFPNFAGLNLNNLFSGLTLPSLDSKAVKITHDFDPQTLRATVNADINFMLADRSTLFTIGPVKVDILKATFIANASLAADKTGVVRRTASGTISGNWQLSLGGTPFVLLNNTALTFDDSGAIKFSVKPQNIQLPGALEVVTGLLNKFVSPDSGLTFGMLSDGFQAILALPVPDIQGVTSGFSNLKLGALFTIEVANSFTMGVGFSLASKDAPFSLTIFVLGGGGYVSARANYTPTSNKLGCQVDMAITASASLAISLAVISGGVYVYFGATASYNTDGQGLTFGVEFLIRGEVSVLGIVSASISLLLEATYGGGTLTGRGQLSIKIQICWCFTLDVNESVSYTLGKQDGAVGEILRPAGPLLAAAEPGPFGPVSDADQDAAAGAMGADIFDKRAHEYVQILI
jgi:hypothetical protein